MLYKISFWVHVLLSIFSVLSVVGIPLAIYQGYFGYTARDYAQKSSVPTKAKIAHLISLISNGVFAGFFAIVLSLAFIGDMLGYGSRGSVLGDFSLGALLIGGGGTATMIFAPVALIALVLLIIARVKGDAKNNDANGKDQRQRSKQRI